MPRTRNISIGVPAELHALYAELGLAPRRRILAEIRTLLQDRLLSGERGGVEQRSGVRQSVSAVPPVSDDVSGERVTGRGQEGGTGLPVALPPGW